MNLIVMSPDLKLFLYGSEWNPSCHHFLKVLTKVEKLPIMNALRVNIYYFAIKFPKIKDICRKIDGQKPMKVADHLVL